MSEARIWWRRSLALARRTGLHGNAATCLVGLGDIELALGNPLAAQRMYERCLSRRLDSPNSPDDLMPPYRPVHWPP